jgi:hypothetical protein
MVNRLEALADAIQHHSGYDDPTHRTYAARNPGRLKAFLPHQKKTVDDLRVFDKHVDGYAALIFDLTVKCTGKSRIGLKSTSPLKELLFSLDFNIGDGGVRNVISYLRRALQDDSFTDEAPLHYFVMDMEL